MSSNIDQVGTYLFCTHCGTLLDIGNSQIVRCDTCLQECKLSSWVSCFSRFLSTTSCSTAACCDRFLQQCRPNLGYAKMNLASRNWTSSSRSQQARGGD